MMRHHVTEVPDGSFVLKLTPDGSDVRNHRTMPLPAENVSSPVADANGARSLEATMGIEPMCTDLQSVA
jgi:hypothetical protein